MGTRGLRLGRGWYEPLCSFSLTIAAPGERKSAVQEAMVKPVRIAETQLSREGKAARAAAAAKKEIAVKRAKQLKDAAAKAPDDERDAAITQAIDAEAAAETIDVPPLPRLVVDDITPEALGGVMADQGGSIAIISSEGGIFDIIGGRYSKTPNLEVFLKGHSGDTFTVDRVSRGTIHVENPALTMGLMVQPIVLHAIAEKRDFRGRGLLARFLFCRPVSKIGSRVVNSPPVPNDVELRYTVTLSRLAVDLAKADTTLTLTPDARAAMVALEKRVEDALGPDGELDAIREWAGKYVGAVGRIAGLLHLAEYDPRQPVSPDTVAAAERLGDYYKASAINAFIEMITDDDTTNAMYLLERIRARGEREISERDMQRAAKRFKTVAEMRPALKRLVANRYLIPLPAAEPTAGRPASPRYRVAEAI